MTRLPSTPHNSACARCLERMLLAVALLAQPVKAQVAPQEETHEEPTSEPTLVPPRVLLAVPAVYPADAPVEVDPATGASLPPAERVCVLIVTVDKDGSVGAVEVDVTAGEVFDRAAIAAAQSFKFEPALRDGAPVAAKIRIPFRFVPEPEKGSEAAPRQEPQAAPRPVAPKETSSARTSGPPPEADRASASGDLEVTVKSDHPLRAGERGASDFTIAREILSASPKQEGAEVLRAAPGLYIARAEGLAIGHRYMLRGFDADHGQDIEFRVGGLPINMPSHLHGQGYADLGFLIPEVVHQLRVSEGVYDPAQGDFAVAGSINVDLGVEQRGWTLKSGYGAFNSSRQLMLFSPKDEPVGTFGAAQYYRTDGFGQNRRGQAASGLAQAVIGEGPWKHRVLGVVYTARSDFAGVVRADDVARGRIGFYDVYPYATARAQNGLASRFLFGDFSEYRGRAGDNAEFGVWLGLDNFRLQENFTGFIEESRTLNNVSGRGDLIEQRNRTVSMGASGRYRSERYRPTKDFGGTLELGFQGRVDSIDQSQNLLDGAVNNQTWDRRVDATVFGTDIGIWGDLDWQYTTLLSLRFGVRADVLSYEVEDSLGNFAPLIRPQDTYIIGFRRSALGVAAGPRSSLEVRPVSGLSFRAAYGEGYRSPQARLLSDGEQAPFSKVRSADLGTRFSPDDRYELKLAGYLTQLSDDVAFEAEEGRLERIGRTRRMGAVAYGGFRPDEVWVAAASCTFVHAELLSPPPPTGEDPDPPYSSGERLPFVPPVVVRLDLGAKPVIAKAAGQHDLVLHTGTGVSYLSKRPLPYGVFGEDILLVDASAGLEWGPLSFDFDVYNLLNRRYPANEFNFPADWDPEGPRSRLPARHYAAGPPISWMATVGLSL